MSKLDELIAELCPDGVEYVRLAECCDIEDNKRKPVKSSLRIPGDTPYYGANNIQDYVEGYTHYGQYVLIAEDGSASLENYSVQYVDGFFWANNHVHVIKGRKDLDTKFLYYYLTSFNFIPFLTGGTRAKLNKGNMEEIPIPLPPIPVQQEIVRILDDLSESIKEITTQLTNELTARRKQYEYYRDMLLSFSQEVEWDILGNCIIQNIGGGTPSKSIPSYWNGNIPWASVKDVVSQNMLLSQTQDFISEEGLENSTSNIVKAGDIIIATRINPGKMLIAAKDIAINQDLRGLKLKPNIHPKFLVYYFQTLSIEGKGTTVKGISIKELESIRIPIPPLKEQERIVSILDRLDALYNDVFDSISAEIDARQKQYEYYRDKLLTFKEVKS